MYKRQSKHGIISAVIVLSVLISMIVIPQGAVKAADYNYGEALQKSIMFFEFQRAGKLPADTRNNWRGDSATKDGADVNLDLTGGWYDAGDHVKFNLPMAYTVTMMAWSVYEYRDAYVKSGQLPYILDNIKWVTDYLIRCHPSANVYYYQVGDGQVDHAWWGPAEVMQMARPSYRIDSANPGSTVVGETAAALAATSIIFKESNPDYSATCLKHAKELLAFADATKSDAGYKGATGFYSSHSGYIDELTWASIWIYLATKDDKYLAQAESYEPKWERELGTTTIKYKWGHCWDSKIYGSLLLLARITNKPLYKECIERNLDWWTVGVAGERVKYTAKGLAWLDMWGSLRYATTEAFIASVYADWSGADTSKAATYSDFAKKQVDYALGSTGRSFVVGFGTNPPKRPHHRTAHGSYMGYIDADTPPYHRHVLVGALVGGPGEKDDYTDDVKNYTNNEVACDYNAGFVAVLARMYNKYGGTPIPNLKAIETPIDDEFSVMAGASSYDSNKVEITVTLANMTAWPARVPESLACRYFVDLSEVISAGIKPAEIICSAPSTSLLKVSSLMPWDTTKNIYYVNVDFSAYKLFPGGINDYQKTTSFKITLPDGKEGWDNKNDYSYDGITGGGWQGVKTKKIPVYENGIRVFGQEPPGNVSNPPVNTPVVSHYTPTTPPTPPVSPSPGEKSPDLNGDGAINIADVMILATSFNSVRGSDKYNEKCDLNSDGAINMNDVMLIAAKFNTRV